jgi:hypothetical protein
VGEGSLRRSSQQSVDDLVLGEDTLLGESTPLAVAQHVPGFIPLDGPRCRGKRPNPQPRIHAASHKPMGLFDDIIQMLAWPGEAGLGEHPPLLKGLECRWIGRVCVHGAHPGVSVCEAQSTWRKQRSAASASRVGRSRKSSVWPWESPAR